MLSLRLTLGARPAALLRRLLVAAASAGTGFLLLSALGHAVGHPAHPPGSLVRLIWCVVPLAAAVHLAVAVARTEPAGRTGLDAAGLGPAKLPLLAAVSTALTCLLGSAVALVAFLVLRPEPLPVAGALTLLITLPLVGAGACAIATRPGTATRNMASALPWGVSLIAAGLALEVYASGWTRPADGTLLPLPGGLGGIAPAVLLGWALTAVGLVLAGPGLVHFGGRLLALHRPGALRLLAGRSLQQEAQQVGRPLGVLCAVSSGVLTASRLHGPGHAPLGALTALGTALVIACAAATALTAATQGTPAGQETTASLTDLGTSASLLRTAALLRTGVLLMVLAPVTWTVAWLAALPLTP